jgi:hypothetical protein
VPVLIGLRKQVHHIVEMSARSENAASGSFQNPEKPPANTMLPAQRNQRAAIDARHEELWIDRSSTNSNPSAQGQDVDLETFAQEFLDKRVYAAQGAIADFDAVFNHFLQ